MRRLLLLSLLVLYSHCLIGQSFFLVKANKLNVRDNPSIQGKVIGSLTKGDTISINQLKDGWGTIIYNNATGYVSDSFIEAIAVVIEEEKTNGDYMAPNISDSISQQNNVYDTKEDAGTIDKKHFLDDIQYYIQASIGISDLKCNKINPKSGLGLGVAFGAHLDYLICSIKDIQIGGGDLSLGYHLRGSAALPINYLDLKVYPVLIRYPIDTYHLLGRIGLYMDYPITNISTKYKEHDAASDIGLSLGFGFERSSIRYYIIIEKGFNNVTNDGGIALYNSGLFASVIYNIDNLINKK